MNKNEHIISDHQIYLHGKNYKILYPGLFYKYGCSLKTHLPMVLVKIPQIGHHSISQSVQIKATIKRRKTLVKKRLKKIKKKN